MISAQYKDQMEKGLQVENDFINLMNNLGYITLRATKWENIRLHIDMKYWDDDLNKYVSVDVKDRKAFNRGDAAQDQYILLELMNVQGNRGWIYGQSDYIAFRTQDDWMMVPTKELRKYATRYENQPIKQSSRYKKPHIKYRRYQRQDCFVYVPVEDIILLPGVIRYELC